MKELKSQMLLMLNRNGFKISFSIVLVYCLGSYVSNVADCIKVDVSYMYSANALYAGNGWSNYWGMFKVIFPFIVVFPFAFSYIDDLRINVNPYYMRRMGRATYFKTKMVTSFIGGVLIILIPFFINLILCNITFPHNNNTYFGEYNRENYINSLLGTNIDISTKYKQLPFLKLYLLSPFLYNLFYIIVMSLFAGVWSMFSLSCSFFINKVKILLFLPNYLILYFGRLYDAVSYNSKQYINFDLMSYVAVDDFYGHSPVLFLVVNILLLLFCFLSMKYISHADGI